MNRSQKISPLPRWLINIGLTLQFYIPGAIHLFYISMMGYIVLTGLSRPRHYPPENEGAGLAFLVGMLLLFILFAMIVWYAIYWLWDRYGNRRNALIFLITTNLLGGGIWLLQWIKCFSLAVLYDPDLWIFSPAPIVIPTILYIIAWRMMRPKETKNG